jgi:hypothetical protein
MLRSHRTPCGLRDCSSFYFCDCPLLIGVGVGINDRKHRMTKICGMASSIAQLRVQMMKMDTTTLEIILEVLSFLLTLLAASCTSSRRECVLHARSQACLKFIMQDNVILNDMRNPRRACLFVSWYIPRHISLPHAFPCLPSHFNFVRVTSQ